MAYYITKVAENFFLIKNIKQVTFTDLFTHVYFLFFILLSILLKAFPLFLVHIALGVKIRMKAIKILSVTLTTAASVLFGILRLFLMNM